MTLAVEETKSGPMINRGIGLLLVLQLAAGTATAEAISPKLKNAFAKARTERVAVVGIGDSNQQFGGHGWSHYMKLALCKEFGCWGGGVAWEHYPSAKEQEKAPLTADITHNAFSSWYLPAGQTAKVSWVNGQTHITHNQPLDITGPVRLTCRYRTFPEEGSIMPSIRLDQPPWTVLAKKTVSTKGQKGEVAYASVDIPADPRRTNQIMGSYAPVGVTIEGPFLGECMRVENPAMTHGLSYTTFYARGGRSLYDMLSTFTKEYGEARSVDFFRELRMPLNSSKTCIVIINSGLNDRNAKNASIGPKGGIEPGSSPEAYGDNLAGVLKILTEYWVKAGGAPETIVFALMPSHPVATPDCPKLAGYRQAALDLAATMPNAGCILLPELVTQREMTEKKHYDKGVASDSHLSRDGYEALSKAVATALAQ